MSVLRVYSKQEWEGDRELDWERCRNCNGSGRLSTTGLEMGVQVLTREVHDGLLPCSRCDGHGSLKAAALAEYLRRPPSTDEKRAWGPASVVKMPLHEHMARWARLRSDPIRCEDCGHPMSEGTWEGERLPQSALTIADDEEWALRKLRIGQEPPYPGGIVEQVHYSSCDEGCRHGGPGRCWYPGGEHGGEPHWEYGEDFTPDWREDARCNGFGSGEASWRPVDVRCLSWAHDLRPEMLAVLCLRCVAERR